MVLVRADSLCPVGLPLRPRFRHRTIAPGRVLLLTAGYLRLAQPAAFELDRRFGYVRSSTSFHVLPDRLGPQGPTGVQQLSRRAAGSCQRPSPTCTSMLVRRTSAIALALALVLPAAAQAQTAPPTPAPVDVADLRAAA